MVKRVTEHEDDKNLIHIEYANILSNEGRLANLHAANNDTRSGISFQKQDILYGKLRPYLNNWWLAEFDGVAVGDFWVFRARLGYSIQFIYALIQGEKYHTIANITTGTKMPRSDWNTVSNTEFPAPTEKEQNQIGNILSVLDDLIVANERQEKIALIESVQFNHLYLTNNESLK